MPELPQISVLMPVYNVERFVASAIDSILSQTFGYFELIITDDGSKDATPAIVKAYAARDSRVRFSQQPNAGITITLNRQIALARGPFLARMDGDDISLPTRFEKQLRFLQEHADHVLVGCQCLLIDPDDRPICPKRNTEISHERIDELLLHQQWPLVHPAVMMRADAIARVGGYNERHRVNEDHELFLRLAEVGRLTNLPEVLFLYRQHFTSTVFSNVEAQVKEVLDICVRAHQRRGLPTPADLTSRAPEVLRTADHQFNWAWWALRSGNVSTARHYAAKVLRARPFSADS